MTVDKPLNKETKETFHSLRLTGLHKILSHPIFSLSLYIHIYRERDSREYILCCLYIYIYIYVCVCVCVCVCVLAPERVTNKMQKQILDNRLYYTRKIELHRKGKESRSVWITPILICGNWSPPNPTGMCGTRPFLVGAGARSEPTRTRHFQKMPTAPSTFPYWGRLRRRAINSLKGVKAWGKSPWCRRKSPGTETRSARSVPQITRQTEVLTGNWRGADRYLSAVFNDRPAQRACVAQGLFWWVLALGRSPHAPSISKNANGTSTFPLLDAPQAPGDDPPLKWVKAWEEGPLRLLQISWYRHTLGPDPCRR